MKTIALLSVLSLGALAAAPASPKTTATNPVHGNYLEARTASVFAGPCHYNSELEITGRDAVMAWDVAGGSYHNINLAGVRAMAAVSSTDSLGDANAPRRSQIIIDPSATPAQAKAWIALMQSHYGHDLGQIESIRRDTVVFSQNSEHRTVSAPGFGSIAIDAMPNDQCCKQPNLVWFQPIVPLEWRKVGYTIEASYKAGVLSDPWDRGDENSAFYGQFKF